jgi:ABC-type glycerol-3-phosphate transport system substrate-binding protein
MSTLNRRRRALPVLAGALAIGLLATACSSGSNSGGGASTTTITFANWADAEPATQAGLRKVISEFERTHPHIKIKSEPISFTDIAQRLLLQIRSGNAPDVAELAGNDTLTTAETQDLQPLDALAGSAYKKSIIPAELQLGDVNGQLLAVPWTVGPVGLWYNKKVLKDAGLDPAKPPTTWDELLADTKAVHSRNPKTIAFGLDSTDRTFGLDTNWPIMKSFGAQPIQGTKPTADSSGMEAYLDFVRQTAKSGYTPVNQKAGFFRQPAASNQVAFTVDGPYLRSVVQSTNKETDSQFYATWGVVPLPTAQGQQHFSVPTDHQLVLFKNSKNKQAAWEFMNYLSTSPAGIQYTIDSEGSLPPVGNVTGDAAKELDNPISKAFLDTVVPVVKRPEWGPTYAKAYSPIMSAVQSAMTGSKSVDSIASSLQSSLESDVK